MTSHAQLFDEFNVAANRAAHTLLDGAAVQWQAPPRPSRVGGTHAETQAAAGEPTEKAKHGISNPTADIVADPRRLKVRAAVVDLELELKRATLRLRAKAAKLEAAVAEWSGETQED
ncbi:hypothetical protein SEA_ZETA1847_41 [Microbacterium phage Zeta1847]|uniref:Uncharacterized protein n=1 Tax=Microbacterium phage Zeta1847 TaxID=2201444 RepID=A0A2Z4Q9U5_9CAUD|nr:hypothetical protein HOT46_gp41 [Microbacterium phage Zeta1847]AWY06675.1 hypothetical protein SEA_ZETA1847_41 [Microbacterium phage Zeta1847]